MGKVASRPEESSFHESALNDTSIEGADVPMSRYAGRVTLVVNVATS